MKIEATNPACIIVSSYRNGDYPSVEHFSRLNAFIFVPVHNACYHCQYCATVCATYFSAEYPSSSFCLSFDPIKPNSIFFPQQRRLSKLFLLLTYEVWALFVAIESSCTFSTWPIRGQVQRHLPSLRATFPARSDSKADSTAQSPFLLTPRRRLARSRRQAEFLAIFWSAARRCCSVCVKFALILFPPFLNAIGFETVTRRRSFLWVMYAPLHDVLMALFEVLKLGRLFLASVSLR